MFSLKSIRKLLWEPMSIFFRLVGQEGDLKNKLKKMKTMIHTHDVINLDIKETGQKTFARDHFQMAQN